ncbi:MAG TPA: putative sugar O-methyltransferase [Caulobacteraceae bacterium]|jgi:hypothetical protein
MSLSETLRPITKIQRRLDRNRLGKERRAQTLSHSMGLRALEEPAAVVADIVASDEDLAITERLLLAYGRAMADRPRVNAQVVDVWTKIAGVQGGFLGLLQRAEVKEVAAYLCNMSRMDATIGTVQGDDEHAQILAHKRNRDFRAALTKDKLVSFAEAVGVSRCETPEQGGWGDTIHVPADELIAALEARIGVSLTPPAIDGGLFKLVTRHGLFHERDLYAQFTAWSLRELIGPGGQVIEIGGGVGRCAYWGHRLGLGRYTVVDLPHIGVLQGFYLLKSLGAEQVGLHGEAGGDAPLQLVPDFAISSIGSSSCDVVLNQDSLPEINLEAAQRYMDWIKQVSRAWFYSVNQEAKAPYSEQGRQLSVAELTGASGGYRRISRTPYWLRRGYVTEIYDVRGATDGATGAA